MRNHHPAWHANVDSVNHASHCSLKEKGFIQKDASLINRMPDTQKSMGYQTLGPLRTIEQVWLRPLISCRCDIYIFNCKETFGHPVDSSSCFSWVFRSISKSDHKHLIVKIYGSDLLQNLLTQHHRYYKGFKEVIQPNHFRNPAVKCYDFTNKHAPFSQLPLDQNIYVQTQVAFGAMWIKIYCWILLILLGLRTEGSNKWWSLHFHHIDNLDFQCIFISHQTQICIAISIVVHE